MPQKRNPVGSVSLAAPRAAAGPGRHHARRDRAGARARAGGWQAEWETLAGAGAVRRPRRRWPAARRARRRSGADARQSRPDRRPDRGRVALALALDAKIRARAHERVAAAAVRARARSIAPWPSAVLADVTIPEQLGRRRDRSILARADGYLGMAEALVERALRGARSGVPGPRGGRPDLVHTVDGPDGRPRARCSPIRSGTTVELWDRRRRRWRRGSGSSGTTSAAMGDRRRRRALPLEVRRRRGRRARPVGASSSRAGDFARGDGGPPGRARRARRVERHVLACTAPRSARPSVERARRAVGRRASGGDRRRSSAAGSLRPSAGPARGVAGFREMLPAAPAEGYAGCCEAIRDADLATELAGSGRRRR